MCGRFTQMMTWSELLELMEGELTGEAQTAQPRYNIAPSQPIMAIRRDTAETTLTLMPWGGKLNSKGPLLFNARAEKYFGSDNRFWKSWRRCIIPANGFYEWKKGPEGKVPMYITAPERPILALGGLYRTIKHGDHSVPTAVILTTTPNSLMAPIHDRMPVIIDSRERNRWLDPNGQVHGLSALATPYPAESMLAWPVSDVVNSAANDRPDCINPVTHRPEEKGQLKLL